MKKLLFLLLVSPLMALAAEGPALDLAPEQGNNQAALQRGARLFVNYCLNCHSAAGMRYNRLHDIGLSDDEIKANLLFTTDKVGDTMKSAIQPADAKAWFGATPPDLTVMARAKGSDYIYTYLRTYYADPARPTGWNNLAYPNTAMPHVLWQLQGTRELLPAPAKSKEQEGEAQEEPVKRLGPAKGGTMDSATYDAAVADLTTFMSYMAEPAAETRKRLGTWVLIFLAVFWVITWRLNAAYWKDIK